MFTGIVTHLGNVRRVAKSPGSTRFDIAAEVGTMGLDMMFRTTTVQVNLDFSSEADMVKKMRVGLALQAIATAKRLGAVVEATDVRPETKEQVESLGAKFIDVPLTDAEKELAKGQGGYARDMGEDYKKRQAALVAERIKQADIVITTALIPGRAAPVLVTEDMVKSMKPGSVIVDMAVEQGGNCPLSELDKTVVKHGVTLVGETNLPALVAADASALYARNLLDFLKLIVGKDGALSINMEDDIVAACLGGLDAAL